MCAVEDFRMGIGRLGRRRVGTSFEGTTERAWGCDIEGNGKLKWKLGNKRKTG